MADYVRFLASVHTKNNRPPGKSYANILKSASSKKHEKSTMTATEILQAMRGENADED